MKKLLKNIFAVCILGALVSSMAAPAGQGIDGIAAVVNDQIITQSELRQKVEDFKKEHRSEDLPANKELRKQILNGMIATKLQLQIADRNHITVFPDELNKQISDIAKRNHITVDSLRKQVEAEGLSYASYRENIKNQMIQTKLQQQVIMPKINITTEQVETVMKAEKNTPKASEAIFHVRDVTVSLPDAPTPASIVKAKTQAKNLIKKLKKKGVDFKAFAMAQSEGSQALSGGDLGWHPLAELPDIFTSHLITMAKGDIAGPIRAPNGFHIIKLEDIKSQKSDLTPEKAREMLFKREFQTQLEDWLHDLRENAYVKVEEVS